MVRAYGDDLRWRVVYLKYLQQMGTDAISETLLVGKNFVRNVVRRYRETGDVKRRPHGSRPRCLTRKLGKLGQL